MRSALFKLLIAIVLVIGLWKLAHWPLTEKDRKWQADKEAFATYIDDVIDLRTRFAHQMFQELGLIYSGDSGRMHGKIEEIGLQFHAYRRASIEEARALQVHVMEKLVQAVNSHEKLAPFLDENPFTFKRVSVSIAFEGPHGRYGDGSVVLAFNISELAVEENRNKLFYCSDDPYTGKLIDLFQEHYDEAIQRASASPIASLKEHKSTPLEEAIDEVLPLYVDEMQRTCRFECWGIGGKMADKVEDIGAHFVLVQRTEQEEARKLLLLAAQKLLNAINSNEKLKPYLVESPFSSDRLRMRISFKKKNYYSHHDGSVESIRLEGNQISYYKEPPREQTWYAGPDVFATENYQEALEKVNTMVPL